MKEQLGNVPEAVSVGVGHCCVARCRGADARNISRRIPDRKFTANCRLRPGCSVGVRRLAARHGPEPAILAAGGMRAGRVGIGERRLDVLRNRAAHGASDGLGSALPVRHAIDFLCARGVSEPGQRRVDAGLGVRAGLRANRHRFLFYFHRILLHTGTPPGCTNRVHPRGVDGIGRGRGAGVAGRGASDARTIEPDSKTVSGFCGVLAGLHGLRGRRRLHADDQGYADGNMVRPWVDHAAAGSDTVGSELAAIAGDAGSAASAAKKIWRAAARQRHTGAGAADRCR